MGGEEEQTFLASYAHDGCGGLFSPAAAAVLSPATDAGGLADVCGGPAGLAGSGPEGQGVENAVLQQATAHQRLSSQSGALLGDGVKTEALARTCTMCGQMQVTRTR